MKSTKVKEQIDYWKSHSVEFDKYLREPLEKLLDEIKSIAEAIKK